MKGSTLPLRGRVGPKVRGGVIPWRARITPTRRFASTSPLKGEVARSSPDLQKIPPQTVRIARRKFGLDGGMGLAPDRHGGRENGGAVGGQP